MTSTSGQPAPQPNVTPQAKRDPGPGLRPLAVLGADVRGRPLPPPHYTGTFTFPQQVLDRHGAVTLRPAEATRLPEQQVPAATTYRAGVLLVTEDLAQDDLFYGTANRALEPLGVSLVKPQPISGNERLRRYRERFTTLSRPVALQVTRGAGPRKVDAWAALQTLRASGALDGRITSVGLDHLLVGSAMVSIGGSPGAVEGSPGAVEGSPGPAVYLKPGTGGRVPVAVALAPPRPSPTCVRRRPVVAVLDTGITDPPHPWLGSVIRTDPAVQAAVQAAGEALAATSPAPVKVLTGPLDSPFDDLNFVQDIDTHAGHGTFIAGVIRQVAPDALITAIRVMHSDGVVYEGDLLAALRTLRVRNDEARAANSTDGIVDVVSLSLGYFDERGTADAFSAALAAEIDGLTASGVLVVAAAGNFSTDRPFYPAAFAAMPPNGGPPVISVGAWNPNGTKALFSNDGPWVTGWALGAALVSTYPHFQGATQAEEGQEDGRRVTLDTDDFSGGFAVWSGSSFAAPLLAAEVAELLFAFSERDGGLGLDDVSAKASIERVGNALDVLRKQV